MNIWHEIALSEGLIANNRLFFDVFTAGMQAGD
jgi:hypothetical protein